MSGVTKVWGTICDGEIEIQSLEDPEIEEALDILNSFFLDECVCNGTEINLPENSQAREDLRELSRVVANEHISLVARHVPTQKLVGVAFNKLQYVDDSTVPFFIEFRDKCKSSNAMSFMNYMIDMDNEVDPFENFHIDCLLELMFLATSAEHRQKGIGSALGKYTIELARQLNRGIGVEKLPKHLQNKRPKAVTALFTSSFSQKVGRVNNFKVLNRVPHNRFIYNGKSYSDRIGPSQTHSEQVAFLL